MLATIYNSVKKDDKKCIEWATRAIENPKSDKDSKSEALRYVVSIYIENKQFKELEAVVEKGVSKGIPHPYHCKGCLYLSGNSELGVERDMEEARHWFLKAANDKHDSVSV